MGYERDYDNLGGLAATSYTIRVTDVFDRVTEYPVPNLEEFTALVNSLGSEKVVLNTRDNSIEIIPRLIHV